MAIFQPPPVPPVFVGGAQPYGPKGSNPSIAAVQVDNPPFRYGGPVAVLLSIVEMQQPNPWVYAFMGGWQPFTPQKLPPDLIAVIGTNPPFTYGGPLWAIQEIANIAQPNPWVYNVTGPVFGNQPYGQRQLNPSITAVQVNEPPYTYGGPVAAIQELANIAQPNPWVYTIIGTSFDGQPYGRRLLSADLVANPTQNPPFTYGGPLWMQQELANIAQPNPWVYDITGPGAGRQPYGPRQLNPVTLAVQVDNPPFAQRRKINTLTAILISWQQANPDQQIRRSPYRVSLTLGYTKGYIII